MKIDQHQLTLVETQIDELRVRVAKKLEAFEEDGKYDLAEFGVYLLWGRQLHSVLRDDRRRSDGAFTRASGFVDWVTEVLDLNIRTAYNYMNLALNAGLTGESTPEDVEKLRETEALLGRKLKGDLYNPPLGTAEESLSGSGDGVKDEQLELPLYRQWVREELPALADRAAMHRDELLEQGLLDRAIDGVKHVLENLTAGRVEINYDHVG